MRVVHVTPYYAPESQFGGPPASIHELCRALRGAGVGVHVVTTGPGAARGDVDGVPVARVARLTRLGFGAAIDGAIDEQLARADVCHIHALFNWPAWRGAARARYLERPTVVSPRGMLEPAALAHHQWRKRAAWRLMDRRVVEGAAALVASTASEAASLRARGLASVVLANGIEPPAVLPERGRFRARYGIPSERQVVVFLGRLHPIKRLDLLAASFVELVKQDVDAMLVLAGPDESGLWPALHRQLAELGDRVRWVGALHQSEKWQLLADSDVLVLCSDSESHGRVVGEALSAGVPVVVTDTCPWPDLEREGMGRTVPQTAPAIAAAVKGMLADPAAHRAASARARAYAAAHLGWGGIVQRYVELYESVLAPSRAPLVAAQAGI